MKSHCKSILLLTALMQPAMALPLINSGGVVNNGSFAGKGMVNSGIAQGSIFAIFGKGLGNVGSVIQVSSFPLQPVLAGTSVAIHSGNATINAIPLYVSDAQVGAVLPSNTPLGPATVTVTYQGIASVGEPITVVRRNFGMFTINQGGTGPAVIQNFNSATDQPVNSLLVPAHPGQTVTLWGTGAGPVAGDEAAAPLPGALSAVNLTVYVGNVAANVRYIGRSGCCAGVDQIDFDIPASVSGCYLPVVVTGAGLFSDPQNSQIPAEHTVSNFGTISVAAQGSSCVDATGLSASDLSTLQRGFGLRLGSLAFERVPQPVAPQSTDFVTGQFGAFNALAFLRTQGVFGLPALGTCLSYPVPSGATVPVDPVRSMPLDIGSALNITGPGGARQVQRGVDGTFAATLANSPSFLNPGQVTVDNGSGGSDIGAFRALFTMPGPLVWTNRAAIGLQSPFAPSFTWTGGDANTIALVTYAAHNDFASFYAVCAADSTLGAFSAPSYALAGNILLTSSAPGVLSLGAGTITRFTASGLDAGIIFAAAMNAGIYKQ